MTFLLLAVLGCHTAPPEPVPEAAGWRELAPGLAWGAWPLPLPPSPALGDGKVHIARIDPAYFSVELRMASRDGPARTLDAWAATVPTAQPVVAINAAMFGEDWSQSVGLLVDGDHTNNGRLAAEQNSLLVARPRLPGLPAAALLNLGCSTPEEAEARYALRVQSIRMLGCAGENVWSPQPDRRWSAALIGQDRAGNLLMMHTRSPWTMHDLVEGLRALPLDLVALHYGDGGPPAALYVRTPAAEIVRIGSYESHIQEDDSNTVLWELPNVVLAVGR